VKQLGVKSGEPLQAPIEIVSDAVVAGDLVEQLGDKTRDAADTFDVPLSAHLCRVLRFWLRADNKAVFYATLKIRRLARVTIWPARCIWPHRSCRRLSNTRQLVGAACIRSRIQPSLYIANAVEDTTLT
jgi:hypothetical protein